MKKNKGITLIALIITIIVLLILAGVSISLVLGDNGIITKAQKAKSDTVVAQEKEQIALEVSESLDDETGTLYIDVINNNIKEHIEDVTTDDATRFPLTVTYTATGNKYKVLGNGTVVEYTGSNNGNSIISFKLKYRNHDDDAAITYHAYDGQTFGDYIQMETWKDFSEDFDFYHDGNLISSGGEMIDVVGLDSNITDGTIYTYYQIAECVAPDSEIIISMERETVLAKDLKEMDKIAYYDFDDNKLKVGTISKVYIHKKATNFVKYTFEDGSYIEVTDYHPIYTLEGWKSNTNRNGYKKPIIADEVKSDEGWKKITKIEEFTGEEDYFDFAIISEDGKEINNYFANGTLVQNSIIY